VFTLEAWYPALDDPNPQRIRFRGIQPLDTEGEPACHFPAFLDGMLQDGTLASKSGRCIVDFLSGQDDEAHGHKHPQGPYWAATFELRVPGDNLLTMSEGEQVDVSATRLDVCALVEDYLEVDAYSSVGTNLAVVPVTNSSKITRAGDTWTADITVPLSLWEGYCVLDARGRW
jgi:hypothetical protein